MLHLDTGTAKLITAGRRGGIGVLVQQDLGAVMDGEVAQGGGEGDLGAGAGEERQVVGPVASFISRNSVCRPVLESVVDQPTRKCRGEMTALPSE
ncbi:hypothetical protein ACFUAC_10610 [Streptomyces sp. NPDC057148]|uniref:hypothetical protein n=1 Tax=unclassified Streptomyces TaxID=2593676 RepID=UPI003624C6CD